MTPPTDTVREISNVDDATEVTQERSLPVVAWASLGFAVLQSLCTALAGLGGARLAISVLSAAAASSFFTDVRWLHQDALRRPMIVLSVLGAVMNLIVVAQIRRLRNRPSARWRLNLADLAGKIRQERWLLGMSAATLAIVAVEECLHLVRHHRW